MSKFNFIVWVFFFISFNYLFLFFIMVYSRCKINIFLMSEWIKRGIIYYFFVLNRSK